MALEQGRKQRGNKGFFENLCQRLARQQRNQGGDETVIGRRFDHHCQLHGGGFHFDRSLGVGREGSVDHVCPMNEIGALALDRSRSAAAQSWQ